ncbi:MAG: carboxypeptidase-like regulatory domain-containing protein [Planctomycetota bacterium]
MNEVERSRNFFRWLAIGEALLVLVLAVLLITRGDSIGTPAGPSTAEPAEELVETPSTPPQLNPPAATETGSAQEGPESPASPAAPEDISEVALFGQVRDTSGKPLKATVVLYSRGGVERGAHSDEYGIYSLAGLEPGKYTCQVDVRMHERSEQPLTVTSAEPLLRHDIVMTPSLVFPVRVLTPDGRPIKELDAAELGTDPMTLALTVVATHEPVTSIPLSNRQDVLFGVGRFYPRLIVDGQVEQPPPGAQGFLEVHGGYPFIATAVLRQTPLTSVEVKSPVEELSLVVSLESIKEKLASATVRVVDAESGEPLTQGQVTLGDLNRRIHVLPPDAQGIVRFEGVPPGMLILAPEFEGYEKPRDYIRLEPSEDIDLGTLALQRETSISGHLSVEQGKPFEIQFRARSLDRMTFPQPFNTGLGGRVAGNAGQFSIEGLGRGQNLLVFKGNKVARTAILVDTSAGDVSDLEVHLPAGTAVTLNLNGDVMQSLLWQILDSNGQTLTSELFSDRATLRLRLSPGVYHVRIYEGESMLKDLPFEVGTEPLELTFKP